MSIGTVYNEPRIKNDEVATVLFNVDDYKSENDDTLTVLQADNRFIRREEYPKIEPFSLSITGVHLEGVEVFTSAITNWLPRFTSSTIYVSAQFTDIQFDEATSASKKLGGTLQMYNGVVLIRTFKFGMIGKDNLSLTVSGLFSFGNTDGLNKEITFKVARDNTVSDSVAHIDIEGELILRIEEYPTSLS